MIRKKERKKDKYNKETSLYNLLPGSSSQIGMESSGNGTTTNILTNAKSLTCWSDQIAAAYPEPSAKNVWCRRSHCPSINLQAGPGCNLHPQMAKINSQATVHGAGFKMKYLVKAMRWRTSLWLHINLTITRWICSFFPKQRSLGYCRDLQGARYQLLDVFMTPSWFRQCVNGFYHLLMARGERRVRGHGAAVLKTQINAAKTPLFSHPRLTISQPRRLYPGGHNSYEV